MPKKRLIVDLDDQIHKTVHELRKQVLEDKELIFFTMHTSSLQSWYRYLVSMGLIKIKEDFDKWKKNIEKDEV